MLSEILIGIGSYAGVGLLSARQTKFHMENVVDKLNRGEDLPKRQEAWRQRHKGHLLSSSGEYCRECYRDDYMPTTNTDAITMKRKWGDGEKGYPITMGALWPVAIPGYVLGKGAIAVSRGVKPAVELFFENPKHRKVRKAQEKAEAGRE